ncbi:T7SS effector LXG polymorphic toxin [Rummeliibacillus pycnus]|uniref:T7SS effector LXG polymorphic toxin n=1 Tax=Rummeliibacillus pycnus TaxID=101070 RepID=UPI003D29D20B
MKVAMEELLDLQLELNNNVKNITAKLDTIKQKTNNISKLHSFQGEAATSTKKYFQVVHGHTIEDLQQTALHLKKNYSQIITTFQQMVDHSSSAIITKDYLLDLNNDMKTFKKDVTDTHHEGEQIITSVSDIIALQVPSISSFNNNVGYSKKHVTEVNENFQHFDQKALNIVQNTKQEVENVMKKIAEYAANSVTGSSKLPQLNPKDFGKVDQNGEFELATMLIAMVAGSKSFAKVLKNINKANTLMTAAAQLYVYYKLDPKSRKILKNRGVHAFTKEQYRAFNNLLSTTLYKFKTKEFMHHLGGFKTKAFTEDNYKVLKDSLEAYGKERGKLAMLREYDKLFGLDKYRQFNKLSLSKKTLKLATTFGDELAGKKYKATKKTIESLPSWKNPKIAYKNAAESFKESTKGMNSLGKSMKVMGKGLGPLGVGISAVDNYKTYKGDTQKVVVGTLVDSAFGAGAAATGATIGSAFFPPIGTVVGAGTGIVVSSLVNLKRGNPPKSITDKTKDLVNEGVNTVKNISKKVVGWFK